MNFNNTYELNISSKKIKNCNNIVSLLHKNGIIANVSSNKTIIKENKKYIIENGCKIVLSTDNPKELENTLWKPLQKMFDLKCAYLSVHGNYSGCIYDFYRDSNCPG